MSAPSRVPGDRRLRWAALAFSLLGLVVSAYLTYIKLAPQALFCSGVGGCDAVNSSSYSAIGGVPIALLGALAYLALMALLLLEDRFALLGEWGVPAGFGLALAGTIYSAWLTYIELAVLQAVCPYCLTSALAISGVLVVSGLRLRGWLADA